MVKNNDSSKPAPPKRPLAPFFLYKQDMYEPVKKENPESKITELTQIIAIKWRTVDAAAKKRYEVLHQEGKKRYDKEKKEYEEQYGKPEKKKKKQKKDKSLKKK